MKLHYPKNIRFECQRCGRCCGDTPERERKVLMLEREVEQISEITNLKLEELFINAYLNGNNADPSKYIDVIMEFSDEEFAVTVKDHGNGLGREKFKALAETLSATMDDHGRGVKIMRRLSGRVDFFKDSDGRFCMRAIKKFDKGAKHSDLAGNAV